MSVTRLAVVLFLLAPAELSAQALQFVEPEQYVSEKSGAAQLVVRRTWSATGLLTVQFHTTNGTATAGQDFLATNGTLSFATDGAEETIFVPLKDDCVREGQEYLSVVLSSLVFEGSPLGELTRATVHLGDDETPGTIEQRLGARAGLAGYLMVPLRDGRYLVNGAYGTNIGIIRLNADFSIDTSFQLELSEYFRAGITYFTVSSNGLIAATAAIHESEGFYDKYLGTFDQTGRRLSWQLVAHSPLELFADRVLRLRPPVQEGSDLGWQADVAIGDRLILQTSTNLSLWQDRSTNLATDCTMCFTNTDTALQRQEFFRIKRVD